jgi:hypothetical protein
MENGYRPHRLVTVFHFHPPLHFQHFRAMRFRVQADLQYNLTGDATYFFAFKCVETGGQHILSEELQITPQVDTEEFTVGVGMNRFTKLEISANGPLQVKYQAEVQTSHSLVNLDSLQTDGTQSLVPDAIPYLFPSRYCQSDRLRQQAMDLFGKLEGRYAIAAGISDWIYEHVTYQSGSSNEQSSAVDTLEQRQGVCRDFAHLGIGFCRAMNIPARYVSVYSHLLQPPDFHAVSAGSNAAGTAERLRADRHRARCGGRLGGDGLRRFAVPELTGGLRSPRWRLRTHHPGLAGGVRPGDCVAVIRPLSMMI